MKGNYGLVFSLLLLLCVGMIVAGYIIPQRSTVSNRVARTKTVDLLAGTKLVSVSWRGVSWEPWYLTRPLREGDIVETYRLYYPDSSDSCVQDTLIIVEHERKEP